MTINHQAFEDPALPTQTLVEPIIHNPTANSSDTISLKLNRQTLVVSALAILFIISAFEAFELTRLHQALKTWQSLPAAAATTTAAPGQSGGTGTLPAQVGGC